MEEHKHHSKLSTAGILISLGIIYGDIGTSPLYVMKAIVGDRVITSDLILGGISCIFWTLTLQTTLKYVLITLQADNKGEGGIFSLYSLVRRKARWIIFPAAIGGCALLADGIITPPISVSSAVEGLSILYPNIPVIPIVIAILTGLFFIQQLGSSMVGKSFGPIMLGWFTMIALLGCSQITHHLAIFKAINPYYAVKLLIATPNAFMILGAVFLCTTGAEALYSDMGHCGKENIRISWIYVKLCLILNYLGQGAWLLNKEGSLLSGQNPFYGMMPEWFLIIGIGIATVATVIASQALITGSFTLISEAVRLNLWPKVKINYPSDQKGQLYVPSINWILWLGCLFVVLFFQKSENMEAAYGLSITLAMLMTTVLMTLYLRRRKFPLYLIGLFLAIYSSIELTFFVGNLTKFSHGGWFTLLLGGVLFSVMWVWNESRIIRNRHVKFAQIEDYYDLITDMSEDTTIPKYASQLVYLTGSSFTSEVESKIIYSMLQKQPKRADVYWLVHVDVVDEPHTQAYRVQELIPDKLVRIDFKLGFRVEQKISLLFRNVVEELVKNGEINILSQYPSLRKHEIIGDFRFVVLEKVLSRSNSLSLYEKFLMGYYAILKKLSLSEERGFGLDLSFVTVEKVPLMFAEPKTVTLTRFE